MSEKRCPLCSLPFANDGSHVRTPELDSSYGDPVYFCISAGGRHVTRRLSWVEGIRRALRRAGYPTRADRARRELGPRREEP